MIARLALLGALVAAPAWAASKAFRAVIIAGGTEPAAASNALEQLSKEGVREKLLFTAGFPKAIESASVEGLKPGFHLAIAGYCAEKDPQAALVRDVLGLEFSGPYLRGVKGDFGGSCPKVVTTTRSRRKQPNTESGPLGYHANFPSLHWRTTRMEQGERMPKTQTFDSLFIDLEVGDRPLSTLRLVGNVPDPRWPFLAEWSFERQIELPNRSLLLVRQSGATSTLSVVGWACGEVRQLLELDFGFADQVSIVPGALEGTFEVSVQEKKQLYALRDCRLIEAR
jgi:hypothetical protein